MIKAVDNLKFNSKNFQGINVNVNATPEVVSGLFEHSLRLLKRVDRIMEGSWRTVSKRSKNAVSPEFRVVDKNRDITMSLKPIYNDYKKSLLLEVDSPKQIERIIIDRLSGNFKYEKSVKTEFGSATTKTYDSLKESDVNLNDVVNDYVDKCLSKFLKQRYVRDLEM